MTSAIWVRALTLVVGAAAVGLVTNAVRPGGVALASFAPPTECTGPHDGKAAAGAEDLAPADAAGLCGQPGVVVADARAASAFAEGHVAGAVHLPCDAGGAAGEALAHFERAQRIVVYGATSEDARPVADSLRRRHPNARVQVLAGGFGAWSSAGLACASGPCDECKTGAAGAAAAQSGVGQSGGATVAPAVGAQSGATAAPSGGAQTGATAAPSGGAQAGATAAPSGGAQTGATAAPSGGAQAGATAAPSGGAQNGNGATAAPGSGAQNGSGATAAPGGGVR